VLNLVLSLVTVTTVRAQTNIDSLSIAQPTEIKNASSDQLQQGMIVAHHQNDYELSSEAYDKGTYGVISFTPAMEFTSSENELSTPVVKTGSVLVLVSAKNGPITKGSLIASSDQPGIGMLATKTGFTLGTAQENFSPTDSNETGLVMTNLDIKFSFAQDSPSSEKIGKRLLDVVSLSTIAMVEEPTTSLKYLVAAVSLIGSIIFSFLTFGRLAYKGVEALGRNPVASRVITLGMMMNVLFAIAIITIGATISYFIIKI